MAHHGNNVAEQFVAAWNKGDLEGALALMDDNVVDHNPVPGQKPGKTGAREALGVFMAAFPDLKFQEQVVVVEGDRVADHGIARGTHKGSLMGIPATGKSVEFQYSDVYRVANGKIAEVWHVEDIPTVMRQIGAMPAPK
ncbi:MAG: ester cyclase [Chloroflexi bacterium]|nr:ester cyclase [Chloroflexota bacterium]